MGRRIGQALAAALLLQLLGLQAPCFGQTSATTNQTMSARIGPIGKLSVPAGASLTSSGTTFSDYVGSLLVSHRVRTTTAGSAAITVVASAEFSPAGGPTVASGTVTYTCGSPTLGTACSGTQVLSTSVQTPVAAIGGGTCTGGGGPCSSSDPNTVSVSFRIINNPTFATGSYSAELTFYISAT